MVSWSLKHEHYLLNQDVESSGSDPVGNWGIDVVQRMV
jgi:hypothetical protein